ncbi:stealth family protein [Paramicrobacterium sp. CJ85]|uniref:stealth family protein n=1 Tax=Paramicrobacterium sp. CJ85 TaxID=3445355 RepID=UPI003F5DFEF8
MTSDDIDFVITWVNDSDKDWQRQRAIAAGEPESQFSDGSDVRYRDWGLLRYWFRAVDECAPWVHRIHLVTDTRLPEWLDTTHSKLNVVDGRELKGNDVNTFSSRSIESQLHRIDGLTEKYVYFNDDFFLGAPVEKSFYFRNGLPYGVNVPTILADGDLRAHAMLHSSGLINRNFSRTQYLRQVVKRTLRPASGTTLLRTPLFLASSRIPPVSDVHVAIPLLKSVVEEAYAAEPEAIDQARRTVFRSRNEIAPIYYAQMWHLAKGAYFARSRRSIGTFFSLADSNIRSVVEAITHGQVAQFCLNDGNVKDFPHVRDQVVSAFDKRYPEQSSFEMTRGPQPW